MTRRKVERLNKDLGRRLRAARQATGFSTRKAVDNLPLSVRISHTQLVAYENGEASIPITLLSFLATVYQRPLNWFLVSNEALTGFRYRNTKSRVGVKETRQFEAVATKWVEAYFKLEERLRSPLRARVALSSLAVSVDTTPVELARSVRTLLGLLDSDPVANVIDVLHACGVRVIEVDAPDAIDAVAAKRGNDSVVALNKNTTNDRLRLNAAHELAHVLYGDCKEVQGWSDDFVEQRAYEFGSHLLLPDKALDLALEGKSFIRLIEHKKKFGISLAAMIYRAEKSKRIRSTLARRLWVEMSQRGWRKNEPGQIWRERAIRFETMLETAIQTKQLTWEEAESVTGITQTELKDRLHEATGLSIRKEEEEPARTLKISSLDG